MADVERIAIRTRESGVTLAGWRLATSTATGAGSITRIEAQGGPYYRGEGAFLGWSQERLAAEYQRHLPEPEDPMPDSVQFG